jgi:hypothetical protein
MHNSGINVRPIAATRKHKRISYEGIMRLRLVVLILVATLSVVGQNSYAQSSGAEKLIGTWASSDSFGDVVDQGSGAYVRSAYTGEAYHFAENGTYWYLIVGSGTVSSGAALQKGRYKLKGNVVTLTSKTESWTPNPNKSGQKPAYKNKPVDEVNKFQFKFAGNNTLHLTQLPYNTHSTFHRTRNSQ